MPGRDQMNLFGRVRGAMVDGRGVVRERSRSKRLEKEDSISFMSRAWNRDSGAGGGRVLVAYTLATSAGQLSQKLLLREILKVDVTGMAPEKPARRTVTTMHKELKSCMIVRQGR